MRTQFRSSAGRLALVGALTVAVGLSAPALSTASQGSVGAEERAARAEERASLRAQQRAQRLQERTARREARMQERAERQKERAARQNARAESHGGAGAGGANDGGAAGSTGEPGASQQRLCQLTVAATADRIMVGESANVTGKLLCPTGTSVAEVAVTAYLHQRKTGTSKLATVTTAEDGSFQLAPAALESNSVLTVRAAGARRARVAIKVAPVVSLAGPSPGAQASATSGRLRLRLAMRATFTGTVSPATSGGRVILQIAYPTAGEHWRTTAVGAVNPDGTYSIAHSFRNPGAVSVRTVVRTGTTNTAGISEVLSYEIPQPQNPQLTIQTSADPVISGESVTISGAAAAVNAPVTLLARTQGTAFATVATGTTDATGDYSFTRQPLQNTYYKVTDAGEQSTPLFEGTTFALKPAVTPDALQADEPLTLSGTVAPASVGQPVYLERGFASGLGFHVIAVTTVNAGLEYTLVHPLRAGANLVRIKVPGDGDHLASTSEPFTITVGS
jgi:hypothetical protein